MRRLWHAIMKKANILIPIFVFVVSAIIIVAASALAEPPETNQKVITLENKKKALKADPLDKSLTPNSEDDSSPYLPEVLCEDIDDAETRAFCWKAYQSGFQYYETGLQQRSRVFKWQHISTRIIFFVVIGLVVAGICFAWAQFRLDILSKKGEKQPKDPQEHQLELSAKGIKIKSSILGVIILALSLGFFFLYLKYVYPITELF